MKHLITFALSAAMTFALSGCIANSSSIANAARTIVNGNTLKPSDTTIDRQYNTGSFSELEVSNGFKVTYKVNPSASPKVRISMPSNYEKHISVINKSGILKIDTKDLGNKQLESGLITITVTAPACASIDISGAVQLNVEGNFKSGNKLEIELSGASAIKFSDSIECEGAIDTEFSGACSAKIPSIKCEWLSIEASGASSVVITNAMVSNDARLDASGASKIDITDMISARRIEADASGTSSVKADNINAKSIDAEASGVSSISMSGKCPDFNKSESGVSKVKFTQK